MKRSLFLILFLILCMACEGEPHKKYRFFYEMVDSIPYDSFDDNPLLKDGKTLQAPLAGTIARGDVPYPYEKTPQDAQRAGEELKNPLPRSPQNLAKGKELYETFCLVCHGTKGMGNGPLIPKFPAPQPFSSDYMKQLPPGRVFHAITQGSFIMGSYASQIDPQDRWKIVHYIQTLQTGEVW